MAVCAFLFISVVFGSHCIEEGLSNTQLIDQARLEAGRNHGGDDDINVARVHRLKAMMMAAEKKCELKLGFCLGSRLFNVYLDECVCKDGTTKCEACMPVPDCAVSTECDELSSLAKAVLDATDVPMLKGEGNYSAFEWPTKEGHVRNCVSKYSTSANMMRNFGSQGRMDPLLAMMGLIRGCSPLLHQVELISGPGSAIWSKSNPQSNKVRDPIFSKNGRHEESKITRITMNKHNRNPLSGDVILNREPEKEK